MANNDIEVRVSANTSNLSDGLNEAEQEVRQTAGDIERAVSQPIDLNVNTEGLQNQMNAAGESINANMTEVFNKVRLAALSALAAIPAMLFAAATASASAAKEISNASQVANAGTTEFQELSYGAKSVGMEMDKLADVYKDVNDKVGDFLSTGGGELKDFFEQVAPRVGVTAEQFRNLSGPQALQLYFNTLQKANLSQAEMTFYMESIADEATALIPLVKDNGAEFARLGEQAQKLGIIMDEQAIAKSKEFGGVLGLLGATASGLVNKIGSELAPTMTKMISGILDAIVSNADGINNVIDGLVALFEQFAGIVGDVISGIGAIWSDLTGAIQSETGTQYTLLGMLGDAFKGLAMVVAAVRLAIQVAIEAIRLVIAVAFDSISTTFNVFKAGFNSVKDTVMFGLNALMATLRTFANVANAALHLNVAGIKASWDAGLGEVATLTNNYTTSMAKNAADAKAAVRNGLTGSADAVKAGWSVIKTDYQNGIDAVGKILNGSQGGSTAPKGARGFVGAYHPIPETGGAKKPKGAAGAKSNVMGELNSGLEAEKTKFDKEVNIPNKSAIEFPIEKERDYWQQVLATQKLSADERVQVATKLQDAIMKINRKAGDAQIKGYQEDASQYRNNLEAKKVALESLVVTTAKIYGKDSEQAKKALQDVADLNRQITLRDLENTETLASFKVQSRLKEVDFQQEHLQKLQNMGLISDREMLARERELEDKRYQIKLKALQDRLALWEAENAVTNDADPKQKKSIENDIGGLNQEHQGNQTGFDMEQQALTMESVFGGLSQRMSNLWDQGIQSMMNGTLTWSNATQAIWADMSMFFVKKLISEPLQRMAAGLARQLLIKLGFIKADTAATLSGQAIQTGAHAVGEATRTGVTATGVMSRMALKAGEAIKSIAMYAWEAMAGAFKAMVSIPIIGPALGVAAGVAAFALVAGLAGKIKSARGGYDIPSGVNPVTQLHEEEMVLPRPYANVIRGMASGNTANPASALQPAMVDGAGFQPQLNVSFNVQAFDSKDAKRYFKREGKAIADSLMNHARNFGR